MSSTDGEPHETASLLAHFRRLNGSLPSNLCRHRLLDCKFLEKDLADPQSFINKKLTQKEKDFVQWERSLLLAQCIGGRRSKVPTLYKFNEAGREAMVNTIRVIMEDGREYFKEKMKAREAAMKR
eukprot:gb/GECG01011478.1/.p1 GENE.gb/GECG01011478.1/~~gb/GECG01011478.1/.p1  ORF type:complete len:125 (+),score=17.10 gb/GECG01011478.1/:1-375(+)